MKGLSFLNHSLSSGIAALLSFTSGQTSSAEANRIMLPQAHQIEMINMADIRLLKTFNVFKLWNEYFTDYKTFVQGFEIQRLGYVVDIHKEVFTAPSRDRLCKKQQKKCYEASLE